MTENPPPLGCRAIARGVPAVVGPVSAGRCRGLRRFVRHAARSDSGVTLLEMVVGLVVMTIFMSMFTGAVVMMYNASSKSEALADTASQVSIAFGRLDTSVRYASAIATPGQSGTDWYVEWLSTYSGQRDCTQVRLNVAAGQLQQRTWAVDSDGVASGLTSWQPLASGLSVDPAAAPFVLSLASDAPRPEGMAMPYQQLSFHLIAQSTGRTGVTSTASDVTFTAFNSGVVTTGQVCTEEGRS
jgi:Tfp pilus assembly protein FimT